MQNSYMYDCLMLNICLHPQILFALECLPVFHRSFSMFLLSLELSRIISVTYMLIHNRLAMA